MARTGRPGSPFPDLAGSEYSGATPSEVTAASKQAADLGQRLEQAGPRAIELTRRLNERRRLIEGRTGPSARLATVSDAGSAPLTTTEDLLVRTSDYDGSNDGFRPGALRSLLERHHLTATQVLELDNRVTRLRSESGDLDAEGLAGLAAMLRQHGYHASVNQVLPLGYVTKAAYGQVGAEPADRERKPRFPSGERPSAYREVTVAVIDTGIAAAGRADGWLENIPRTQDNIDALYAFNRSETGSADSTIFDFGAGHGTFISGIIQQVAPFATIRNYRAVDGDGIGSDVDVASAMWRAVKDGATVLNLSVGTVTPHDQPPVATQVALELIAERESEGGAEVVVVASAGNNGNRRPVWPAAFNQSAGTLCRVIAVAGLSLTFEPASWSTHGFWVDCATAGEGVLSTFVAGSETPEMDPHPDTWSGPDPWAVWTGTSFAAPQVAGAIVRRCQETGDSAGVAASWLLRSGVSVPDYGRTLKLLPVG